MDLRRYGFLLALILGLGLVLFAPACDLESAREDSASPDWSRGLRVGQSSLNNPLAFLVDDAGRAHLAWVTAVPGGQTLHYVRISAAGQVEVDRNLAELAFGYPDSPQFLPAQASQLHLVWLTRTTDGAQPQGFYHVLLSAAGDMLSTPRCLSGDIGPAAAYGDIAPAPNGGLYAFWSHDLTPGCNLYGARLDAAGLGAVDGPPLVTGGAIPQAQTDDQGRVHLLWQQVHALPERTLHYGTVDASASRLDATGTVTLLKVGVTSVLHGPVLGLTHDRAYVLWSLENRGKEAGTARTFYLTWPFGQPPQLQEPHWLWLPDDYRPEYVPAHTLGFAASEFGYTALAPAHEGVSSFVNQPAVLTGQHAELPVALVMNAATRRDSTQPVGLLIFVGGEPRAYQLITRADGLSARPALAADAHGHLYAAWMRSSGPFNYEVFYASTAPAVHATLDPWTPTDVANRGLDYSWSLGVALGFFPLAMVWVFFSFIWLGLTYLVLGDVELDGRRGWIILIIALLLHFFSKFFSMPGMLTFIPFAEALPKTVGFVLGRLLSPLLLSGLSLLVMVVYLRRAEHRGAFGAYVVFALVDILVSLLVYIPTLIGGNY